MSKPGPEDRKEELVDKLKALVTLTLTEEKGREPTSLEVAARVTRLMPSIPDKKIDNGPWLKEYYNPSSKFKMYK